MAATRQQHQNYIHAVRDFTGYVAELRAGCTPERRDFIRREAITCDALMVHSELPRLRKLVDEAMSASQQNQTQG